MKLYITHYLFLFKLYFYTASSLDNTSDNYRSVGYYVNWAIYGRQFFPQELPVANLTHILYAFANINPESGAVYLSDLWADINAPLLGDSLNSSDTNLYGCLQQMYILKKQNRNLKVLLSIGGSTYSSNFPLAISTISKRTTFASSVVSLVGNLGLDGVDIDWEYPADDIQANNFVSLLQTVRDALDKFSNLSKSPYHFLLTVAGPAYPNVFWKLSEMDQYVDFWNFMGFDYSGSWSSVTAHQSNLSPSGNGSTPFNTEAGVSYYISHGVASDKIVLGMPIYGRSFEETEGFNSDFQGVGQGTWSQGVYDYKALPLSGATEIYDETIGASYSWDSSKLEIVTYDNPAVAAQKGKWIQSMNLGGAMWWETSADGKDSRSLIGIMIETFDGHIQNITNTLSFPNSSYLNIRNGMPDYSKLPIQIETSITTHRWSSSAAVSLGTSPTSDCSSEITNFSSKTILDSTALLPETTISSTVLGSTAPCSSSSFANTAPSSAIISSVLSLSSETPLETSLDSTALLPETTISNTILGSTAPCSSSSFTSTAPSSAVTSSFSSCYSEFVTNTAPSIGFTAPSSGGQAPFSNHSHTHTAGFQSLSSTSSCSFASSCSIITTTYSFSTSTTITSATTTSVSFPISIHSVIICTCQNRYFGVKYATAGATTTTLCGNFDAIPTGFTLISPENSYVQLTTATTDFRITITTTTTLPTRTTTIPISTREIIVTTVTSTAAKRSSGCSKKLSCTPNSTAIEAANYSPTGSLCALDINNDLVCIENSVCLSSPSCTANDDCAHGEICVSVCCQRACYMDDSTCMSQHCAKLGAGCLDSS